MKVLRTLKDFLQHTSQRKLAQLLNISQSAIVKIAHSNRDIRILQTEDEISAWEVRRVKSNRGGKDTTHNKAKLELICVDDNKNN